MEGVGDSKDTKIQKLEAMIENMDIAKKAYLVNLYHKAGYKHEPYLETENKRPGPAFDETKAEKEEMQDRENFAAMERKKKRFLLTSNKLNLELIDWNKLVAVHNLKNEVNKIFFVSQPTGAFVIKMCSEVVPTYFASRLLQCLQIPTPDVKILPFYEQEFKAMVHSMEGLTLHDDHLRYIVRLSMDRPFILLQEYIPAITLDKIGEKRAERCLSTNYADASSRLINLGRIIAADILMNNMDRFPLIWDNDGNYTNILFEVKTDEKIDDDLLLEPNYTDLNFNDSVAIDTVCHCIDESDRYGKKGAEKYFKKVKDFIDLLFADLKDIISGKYSVNSYEYESMKRLAAFIHTYSSYDIRGRSLFRIIEGIIIGFFNIKNMGMEVIQQVLDHTSTAIRKDWKGVWENGASTIKIEFLKKVYDIICECLFRHPKQLRWVLRTHLCNFVVDKAFRDEADSGFIIKKYLDEEGVKMLEDLEHNLDDEAQDLDDNGFDQYQDNPDEVSAPREEYKGYLPKDDENTGGLVDKSIRNRWETRFDD